MATPSPGHSITLRVQTSATFSATSDLAGAVAETGAAVTALDVVESSHEFMIVDVSANTRGQTHSEEIADVVNALEATEV